MQQPVTTNQPTPMPAPAPQAAQLNLPVLAVYGVLAYWGYTMKGDPQTRLVRAAAFPGAWYLLHRAFGWGR